MDRVGGTDFFLDAACLGVDDWMELELDVAQDVCADCPVVAACLGYALRHRIFEGVWGGTTGPQRRRLLRQHATAVR